MTCGHCEQYIDNGKWVLLHDGDNACTVALCLNCFGRGLPVPVSGEEVVNHLMYCFDDKCHCGLEVK